MSIVMRGVLNQVKATSNLEVGHLLYKMLLYQDI